MYREVRSTYRALMEYLKGREHFREIGADRSVILKWIRKMLIDPLGSL
jgi:hypothetical protein